MYTRIFQLLYHKITLNVLSVILLSSCAFLFYNYNGVFKSHYSIPIQHNQSKQQIEKTIMRMAVKEQFYMRKFMEESDSIYLYGPDYHSFRFKFNDSATFIRLILDYYGYHGFKRSPPHALFLQQLRDTLRLRFAATETVIINRSNQKLN